MNHLEVMLTQANRFGIDDDMRITEQDIRRRLEYLGFTDSDARLLLYVEVLGRGYRGKIRIRILRSVL